MSSHVLKIGIVGILFSTTASTAYAEYSVEEQLKSFAKDPKAFLNSRESVKKYEVIYTPTKFDQNNYPIEFSISEQELNLKPEEHLFSPEEMPVDGALGGEFVDIKNRFHEGLKQHIREGRAQYEKNDDPELILGKGKMRYRTLRSMDKKSLMNTKLGESPWSGDYWPIYTGQIAKRYADENFPISTDWHTTRSAIENPTSSSNDELSPAEKYELLVGDAKRNLTQALLSDGQSYFNKNGSVETWMGLCHGWAAASYMVPRPKHSVDVLAWDGKTKIRFYPSDIKALATLLWAKAKTPSRFMGTRCNEKDPATDENGRVISQECFDTNPGAWHLAVVNQIGHQKKSMIIDATFDYEVWNQPLQAYEYSYFNPQTLERTSDLRSASVKFENFTNDKFRRYRERSIRETGKRVDSVVGIAMKLTYIAETRPTLDKKDSEDRDRRVSVNYLYDLELDEKGNIIGGEWYTNLHPDFAWTPEPDSNPMSTGDEALIKDKSKWKRKKKHTVPDTWHRASLTSGDEALPLARVVNELVKKSRKFHLFH